MMQINTAIPNSTDHPPAKFQVQPIIHPRINCGLIEKAAPQLRKKIFPENLSPEGTFSDSPQFIRGRFNLIT
jgi:hypothetical protein